MMRVQNRFAEYFRLFPFRSKFGRDVLWNTVSTLILGITGIVVNALIARFYGPGTLGVFNQVLVIYLFTAQFSVGGLQFSVLRHVSQYADQQTICNRLISSAIAMTVVLALAVSIITWALRGFVGRLLGSPDVSTALTYVLPGITFFAVNKVLMAVINANRHMRAFSVFQASRYLLILLLLVGAIITHRSGVTLAGVLSVAELLLLICLIPYCLRLFTPVSPMSWFAWCKKHIVFGAKSFFGGVLTEINTRVDILMLGFFLSDRSVGIYSLAAFVAEGLLQLPVVLRTNVNPLITKKFFSGQTQELSEMIRRGVKLAYVAMGFILLLAVFVYPLYVRFLVGGVGFMSSWPLFGILAAGIAISSGYLPFRMILLQTGYPGMHTLFVSSIAVTNVMLNAVLIPFLGMYGAAFATALSLSLSVVYLMVLVRRCAGMSL